MKRALQWMWLVALLVATRAGAIDKISLLLGEQKTIEVQNVTRVAVGDGNVLNVKVVSPSELLLSGLAAGVTTMTIWNGDGQKETLTVQVYAQDPEEVRKNVESLLQIDNTPVEGTRVRIVGDRVVIDGEVLKDTDAKRVDDVAKLFPSVVNLTTFNRSFNLMKQMVELDLQFYSITKDNQSEVGIDWANIIDPVDKPLVTFQYVEPVNGPAGSSGTGTATIFSDFNPVRMRGTYQGTRMLAEHKMVVRNAEKAHYVEGGTLFIIAQSATGSGQIREVEFGFVVDVTPEVDKANNVVLTIQQQFTVPDRAQLIAGFPTFQSRNISTTVNLAVGQSVMLSGFLTETLTKEALGIPGFANLPVLGALFGSQTSAKQRTEGVLFITPTLVRGVGTPGEDPFIRGILDRYHTSPGPASSVGQP
jgi:pilus assembly protein CpaC